MRCREKVAGCTALGVSIYFRTPCRPWAQEQGSGQGSDQGSEQGGHVEEGRHQLLRDQAHEVLEGLLLRLRVGGKLIRPIVSGHSKYTTAMLYYVARPACVPDA